MRQCAKFIFAVFTIFGLFSSIALAADERTKCNKKKTFCIQVIKDKETAAFYALNKMDYIQTVSIDLTMKNMFLVTPNHAYFEVSPSERKQLFTLQRKNQGAWKYKYTFFVQTGSASTHHDDSYIYQLPYEVGQKYRVSQSCHGSFSHSHEGSKFALDFVMKEGTPVHAARSGRVIDLYEYSIVSGQSSIDYRFSNYVLIQHDDFTIAGYHHLKTNGVAVKKGDFVDTGQMIGYSGTSGYSTGPHLHFVVKKPVSGKFSKSIEVRFATSSGVKQCMKKGEAYFAVKTDASHFSM